MSHFAQVIDGKVMQVIVAEQDFIDSGLVGDAAQWIQTSYNTTANTHVLGGTPLRKNYAGIGYTYDSIRDAFIPPKTYESWILNEETCLWEAPVARPNDDSAYTWDEETLSWVLPE